MIPRAARIYSSSPEEDMPQYDAHAPKKLFRVSEVAEILSLCKSKVERLIKTGDMPSVRIGRSLRVHAEDLDAWLDARRPSSGSRGTEQGQNATGGGA